MHQRGHWTLFGACLACVAYGVLETLQGHIHHALPWFAAVAPGAGAARLALLNRGGTQ